MNIKKRIILTLLMCMFILLPSTALAANARVIVVTSQYTEENPLELSMSDEKIEIQYVCGIKGDFKSKENILNQLKVGLERDIEYKMTMTGPHRDDFDIFMNGKNIKKFGS